MTRRTQRILGSGFPVPVSGFRSGRHRTHRNPEPDWNPATRPPPLVRHVPLDRESVDSPARRSRRARRELQRSRPRRRRRFDGRAAPRARLLESREALSAQRHVPRHLLASRQHAAAARRDARCAVSLVRRMGVAAHAALSRVRGEEAGESGARLRRPAALLARDDGRRAARGRDRRRVRSHPRRRVSGHERPAGGDPEEPPSEWRRRHRRRRRCAGDLFISGSDGRQHPRLSGSVRRRERPRLRRSSRSKTTTVRRSGCSTRRTC